MWRFFFKAYFVPAAILLLLWVQLRPFLFKALDETGVVKRRGRIAFCSNRDGNWEIYTMNPDGFGLHRLTRTHDIDERSPVWSPDGKCIAFVSRMGEVSVIEVMSASGRKRHRLTDNSAGDTDPCWSPDCRRIVFSSNRDGNAEIYIMNADGSEVRRLTDYRADDYCPKWPPGEYDIFFLRKFPAKKISFHVERVYSISPDGGEAIDVTDKLPCHGQIPSWSKDGYMLAFPGELNTTNNQGVIYTCRKNCGASKQITYIGEDEYDGHPTWSPDGGKIAFTRSVLYNRRPFDIYVIDLISGKVINLTKGKGDNECPDWSR